MDERTKVALLGSIAKWEGIIAGTVEDNGPKNCPLCAVFWHNDCNGCPVREKTGEKYCNDSPYEEYAAYIVLDTPEALACAQAEVDFLRSLLPVDTTV